MQDTTQIYLFCIFALNDSNLYFDVAYLSPLYLLADEKKDINSLLRTFFSHCGGYTPHLLAGGGGNGGPISTGGAGELYICGCGGSDYVSGDRLRAGGDCESADKVHQDPARVQAASLNGQKPVSAIQ